MIATRDQLPLLRLGHEEVVQYEESWVHDIIRDAAERSGCTDSWFTEDIAKGVILYLKKRFPGSSIDVKELFEKIDKTLRAIGFEHVAGHLEPSTPPASLSLSRLAKNAGDGYELVFFQLLSERLGNLRDMGTSRLHCSELRDAVVSLCRAKRWSPKCERLQIEILEFVANQMARSSKSEVSLMVS